MTSYDLISLLANVKAILKYNQKFFSFVAGIIQSGSSITNFEHIFHKNQQEFELSKKRIDEFSSMVRNFSIRDIYDYIRDAELAMDDEVLMRAGMSGFTQVLRSELAEFAINYEKVVKGSNGAGVLPLIQSARTLESVREATVEHIDAITNALSPGNVISEGEATIEIVLGGSQTVDQFASKLLAVRSIYSECCLVLSVSESEYPLRIKKIESGSEYMALIGGTAAIGLLGWVIRRGVNWYFENFTQNGRIDRIPKDVESLNSLLQLREKLLKAGQDVSNLDELINKAGISIANELNILVDREHKVIIDDEPISVGEYQVEKFLEASKTQLLGEGKQEEDSRD